MSDHSLLQVDYLLKCLKDSNKDMRSGAANTLAEWGDERAVLPLIEALRDEEKAVRAAAAYALGELGDERAITPLIEALEDIDKNVQQSAKSALLAFPDNARAIAAVLSYKEKRHLIPPEAKKWLTEASNKNYLAGNRFDSTAEALRFVEQLYQVGATKVLISNLQAKNDGYYADALEIEIPDNEEVKAKIYEICETELVAQGFSLDELFVYRYPMNSVILWWD